jgi:hypothetical protein
MELLGEWVMWNLFSGCRQCLYRCNIGARFALNVPLAQISFWKHPTILLGDEAQGQACLSPFGDSANLDAR